MIVVTNCLCLSWFPELSPKVFVSTALSGAVKDSRQRKTREALEKLTAVYSVPELQMAPWGCYRDPFFGWSKEMEKPHEMCPEARKTIKQRFYV